MKNILTPLIGSVFVLSAGLAQAGNNNHASKHVVQKVEKKAHAKVEKKAPSFLFVVSAKKALLSYKNGKHTLTIKKDDLDKVIEFSDRPYRIVEKISSAELQALWPEGKNSFKKDPPNAVLSGANKKPSIVILTGMESTKDSIKYHLSFSHVAAPPRFEITQNWPQQFVNIVLVIDVDSIWFTWMGGKPFIATKNEY